MLSWPVGAGDWYMSDGCCADDTHHRRGLAPINGVFMVPQRFAIDFYKLDDQHRAWVGDPAQLTSYASYRQPIVAATAGTVVAAQDGLPNNDRLPKAARDPGHRPDGRQPRDRPVRTGAVPAVRAHGPDVGEGQGRGPGREGQQLGLIGTSGNSTVPHLHFQVLTQPTFFPSDSTPFVFDRFVLAGRATQRIWDDIIALQPTGTMPFAAANPGGDRTDEMPLDRTSCASAQNEPVELDHVFCMVTSDDDWAARLAQAGWRLDAGSTHAGQGTRNRRLRWADCYLELLWVHDRPRPGTTRCASTGGRGGGAPARARSASACAGG